MHEDTYDDAATTTELPAGASPSGTIAHERRDPSLLLRRGTEAVRANDVAAANEPLSRAVGLDPGDRQGQFQLGVALQAVGRHAEALQCFKAAQDSPGDNPAPFLHAAISHLAIDDNAAALVAASAACWRAPKLAAAHYAYGQAWAALGEPMRAEQAFAAAIQLSPRWADAWVNYGLARYRQGEIEDAKVAMREALRYAPGHATAKANLAALGRMGVGGPAAASAAPGAGTSARIDRRGRDDKIIIVSSWRPKDSTAALGLAVEFLSRKPAFARLQFGEWSQVLFYQVARGHFFFVVDQDRRVRGFLGWALTREDLAEKWVEGRAGLRDDECREGDCVIVNAFAAETADAKRFIVNTMRRMFANKRTLYFKRHYRDGRTRPMRLNVNDFVAGHLSRYLELCEKPDAGDRPAVMPVDSGFDGVTSGRSDDTAMAARPPADGSSPSGALAGKKENQSPLFRREVEALRENNIAAAIELLSKAVELDASGSQSQLQLGVALQAAARHHDALECFKAAQDSPGDNPAPFLHAAVSHLALGDHQAALVAASEACWRAPKLAAAHYAYGQAFAALGEAARAEQAFAAAIQLSPRWADAWVNYGLARYRQGAIDDAKTAMQRALAAEPNHAAALSNLGAFMRISGELEDAERLLRESVERAPDGAGARLNLAADLLQEERAAEAMALLNSAPTPSDPAALRHWRLQQALALLQLGRAAEARNVLDALMGMGPTPPALAPLLHWRLVLLALAEGDAARASDEAQKMEQALADMGPDAVPEHAIMARYDLAKFWSGQGVTSRAFAHWTAGHKMLARFQRFSRDAHRGFVNASIEAFCAARLTGRPRASNRDPAPVFVVGMPRSGTTLVEQILAAHRDVHGAGERTALGHAFAALGGPEADASSARRIAALDSERLDQAAERYLIELHELAPDARRVVDKMPGNFLYLGLVGLMLPAARVIHCVRDPRDIGLSIFTFRFHGAHEYAHDLADLGWYIGEHDRLMAHWKSALPNPILTVRLNDWVVDFDATLERVLDHLELPLDANCTRFYESQSHVRTVSRAQVRQPVNARGLGRWVTYASELAPLIVELDRAGSLEGWRNSLPRK